MGTPAVRLWVILLALALPLVACTIDDDDDSSDDGGDDDSASRYAPDTAADPGAWDPGFGAVIDLGECAMNQNPNLAVDSRDVPWIACKSPDNRVVGWTIDGDSVESWAVPGVETDDNNRDPVRLFVSTEDEPQLAYRVYDGIWYATRSGDTWTIENPVAMSYNSFDIAHSNDSAMIAYMKRGETATELMLTVRVDGQWNEFTLDQGTIETQGAEKSVTRGLDLNVDPDGYPLVAYTLEGELRLGWWPDNVFTIESMAATHWGDSLSWGNNTDPVVGTRPNGDVVYCHQYDWVYSVPKAKMRDAETRITCAEQTEFGWGAGFGYTIAFDWGMSGGLIAAEIRYGLDALHFAYWRNGYPDNLLGVLSSENRYEPVEFAYPDGEFGIDVAAATDGTEYLAAIWNGELMLLTIPPAD